MRPMAKASPPDAIGRSTAFVLSGGGNQGVEPGRDAPGAPRARVSSPTSSSGRRSERSTARGSRRRPIWRASTTSSRSGSGSRGEDVFPGDTWRRAWNLLRRDDHIIATRAYRRPHRRAGPAETFEELQVPLRVVAADLITGDEHMFVRGPLHSRCSASAALPGHLPAGAAQRLHARRRRGRQPGPHLARARRARRPDLRARRVGPDSATDRSDRRSTSRSARSPSRATSAS